MNICFGICIQSCLSVGECSAACAPHSLWLSVRSRGVRCSPKPAVRSVVIVCENTPQVEALQQNPSNDYCTSASNKMSLSWGQFNRAAEDTGASLMRSATIIVWFFLGDVIQIWEKLASSLRPSSFRFCFSLQEGWNNTVTSNLAGVSLFALSEWCQALLFAVVMAVIRPSGFEQQTCKTVHVNCVYCRLRRICGALRSCTIITT